MTDTTYIFLLSEAADHTLILPRFEVPPNTHANLTTFDHAGKAAHGALMLLGWGRYDATPQASRVTLPDVTDYDLVLAVTLT